METKKTATMPPGFWAERAKKIATSRALNAKAGITERQRRANRRAEVAGIMAMHTEIARRLAFAFTSYQGRITYETARRRFGHAEPGRYWIALAEQVCADYSDGRVL
jgi:hypothetical protein